ncbi:MAG: DUF5329 family protein [Stagnimonas sp.]|nr:DUF5329 family protein [Stagnimonas sp.]
MRRGRWAGLALLLCAAGHAASDTSAEVAQLLSQLASSGCEFQRNGEWHDGPAARAHLERKYAYLLKKNLVASTEDFIERGASRSSASGQPYQVRCGAETSASGAWLRAALARLRARR